MAEAPAAVIFDLDGTLVDTAPDLLASLNDVLVRAGHRAVGAEEFRHLVGHGVHYLFERAFAVTGKPYPADLRTRFHDEFLVHYRANIARESRPFPGVVATLQRLAGMGCLLGVCTNKPHDLTGLLLDELDLTRHFQAVIGAGRAPYNKPDPRHVLDVLADLGGDARRAVFVGDSGVDVAAARGARLPVVVMSYGYTPTPPHELGADAVTGDFTDLPGLITKLMG